MPRRTKTAKLLKLRNGTVKTETIGYKMTYYYFPSLDCNIGQLEDYNYKLYIKRTNGVTLTPLL